MVVWRPWAKASGSRRRSGWASARSCWVARRRLAAVLADRAGRARPARAGAPDAVIVPESSSLGGLLTTRSIVQHILNNGSALNGSPRRSQSDAGSARCRAGDLVLRPVAAGRLFLGVAPSRPAGRIGRCRCSLPRLCPHAGRGVGAVGGGAGSDAVASAPARDARPGHAGGLAAVARRGVAGRLLVPGGHARTDAEGPPANPRQAARQAGAAAGARPPHRRGVPAVRAAVPPGRDP